MKKKKVTSASPLPSDFSSVDAPSVVDTSVVETPTKEAPVVEQPIPILDKDAELKIEEEEAQPEELPQVEKKGKLMLVLGSILAVFVIIGVGVLAYLYFVAPAKKEAIIQPTPTPEITATITPNVTLDKKAFTFEILNASGISGQAVKTQTIFEDLGYTVSSIGNANSIETGMKLLLSEKLVNQKDLLLADLVKEFPTLIYSGVFASDTVNARIIIGE